MSLFLLIAFSVSGFSQIDKIVGKWKTIDDEDGKAKSIVLIFKATNGKYYGKIEKLFKNPDALCTECEGANKNKPTLGLMVVNAMEESKKLERNGNTSKLEYAKKVIPCYIPSIVTGV